MDERYYTVTEISELWKTSYYAVARLIRDGKLWAFKVGKSYRIPETSLREYEQANVCKPKKPDVLRHRSRPVVQRIY